MDERNDFPLSVCDVNMDSDATDKQNAADARLRAEKIASALNEWGSIGSLPVDTPLKCRISHETLPIRSLTI